MIRNVLHTIVTGALLYVFWLVVQASEWGVVEVPAP